MRTSKTCRMARRAHAVARRDCLMESARSRRPYICSGVLSLTLSDTIYDPLHLLLMTSSLPQSFRQLIKPIEAVGFSLADLEQAFLATIGGEDSEDDEVCDKCEKEKEKEKEKTSPRRSSKSKGDKVSKLRDSVRLHKSHGSEANNALRHAKLGRALHGRFELHGDPHDLDEAITHLSTAMAILPPRHKHRPMYESNVGLMLCVRYEHTHADKDLERAVTYCRNSLNTLESQFGDSYSAIDKAWYRANLATALLHRYERHKQLQNLEESLTIWKTAISSLPDGHPDKASYQSNLSAVYLARYQNTNSIEDLDRSITSIRAAIRGTPTDDIHWVVYKYMASSLFFKRWTRSHREDDIDRSIEAGKAALAALPNKHRYSSKYQSELATKLLSRYDQTGRLEDVNEAIDLSKDAAVTFAHASYPAERNSTPFSRLTALSQALTKRFEKTDEISDLDEAIKHAKQAAAIADKSRSPERHTSHFTVANLIYTRFERLGQAADLDESISHSNIAVDATPGSKSQKDREDLSEKLSVLSSHHLTRFEFQREPADLDAAVNFARTALELKKAGDGDGPLNLHPHPATRYALALALFRRFEQTGDLNDLEGALKNAQLAYDAVSRPSPASRRLSLSTSRTAVSPETDSRKTLYQSLLSGVLCARYKRLGNKEDLDGAIAHAEAILQATPPDHPLYEMYKSIHEFALKASPPEERASTPEDVIAQVREEAEQAKASKDPNWGRIMLRLCNLRYLRYEENMEAREEAGESKLAEDLDLEHVLGDWRKIATAGLRTVPSPPSVRFRAALKWANVSCLEGRYKSAVEAYKIAMSLAPRVSLARRKGMVDENFDMVEAPQGEENELLLNTFSLASDAAAAAIHRGQLETAIEFIEQSRELLWKDALGLPSDLDRLETTNPSLASHLSEVLEELEQSINRGSPGSPIARPDVRAPWLTAPREKVKSEGSADDRWNSIVGTVRASEAGFQNFLRPWSLDSLREEDAPVPVGPVVLLNSSYLRCDAIILVSTNEPVLVPLEQTSKADLERLAAQVITGVKELEEGAATGFQFDKAVMEPVLKELWERVVSPILKKLDEVAFSGGKHVGLVPTGAFTWLPLHAASAIRNGKSRKGSDSGGDEEGGATPLRPDPLSRYSFYYSTTLQSLLHHPRSKSTNSSRVLVVSDQPSRRASLLGGIVTSIQALKSQLFSNATDGAEDPVRSNIHIESLEGPAVAVPDAIFKALRPAPVLYESGEETDAPEGVDAVHLSCPTFCDALRPASSSWRVADGSSIRISDLFTAWFYSRRHDVPTLPEFVFSSTTSHRIDGPATAGSGAVRLPQELMTPEAALQFAGVKGVIGQLWNAKSEDASVIATHVYKAAVTSGGALRDDRPTHTHPITGKVSRGRGVTSPNGSTPVGHHAGPAWETKGLEDGLTALRAANVPLFRTVPFVRYGP